MANVSLPGVVRRVGDLSMEGQRGSLPAASCCPPTAPPWLLFAATVLRQHTSARSLHIVKVTSADS